MSSLAASYSFITLHYHLPPYHYIYHSFNFSYSYDSTSINRGMRSFVRKYTRREDLIIKRKVVLRNYVLNNAQYLVNWQKRTIVLSISYQFHRNMYVLTRYVLLNLFISTLFASFAYRIDIIYYNEKIIYD